MIHYLQHFEILLKCVKSENFNGIFLQPLTIKPLNIYLFFKNISESYNYKVAMKYFSIFDKNVETIFQLQ